jgi:FtsH-binding integral membrane protein
VADRAIGLREVLVVAGLSVLVVLGAAVVTGLLPPEGQAIVFRTPLLIVVLLVGTAAALWRIARPRPPGG